MNVLEIIFLESYGNYVKVWTNSTMILANSTLKALLQELPSALFTQINKSVVINTDQITGIEGRNVTLSGDQIKKTSRMFIENEKTLLKS